MSLPLALAVATATVATSSTAAEPSASGYAVVIGVNRDDGGGRAPLAFADDDAARFYELFSRTATKALLLTVLDAQSQENFPTLKDVARPPTVDAVREAFEDIASRVAADRAAGHRTEVWFYFAGHGDLADGEGYVSLLDGRLTRTQFSERFLDGIVADRKHVIVDACKSYFFVAGRGPGGRRVAETSAYAGPPPRPGVGYVLSTSSDVESHEWAAYNGGVFSHEVRSAIVGGGDLDGDGHVSYPELSAFVAVANEGIPFPKYRPRVFVRAPEGDLDASVFSPSRLRPSFALHVPSSARGRVSIVDHRGLAYADLHPGGGTPLTLALLMPGSYAVAYAGATRVVRGRGGQRATLEQLPTGTSDDTRARALIHDAFSHLFSVPLTNDVLRGYRLGRDVTAPLVTQTIAIEEDDKTLTVVLVGSALAAVGTGIGLFAAANGDRNALIDPNLSQMERITRADRADALTIGATIAFSTGAAALITALVLELVD